MFTIAPPFPPWQRAILRTACWQHKNRPKTLTSNMRRVFAKSRASILPIPVANPALLTNAVIGPSDASTDSKSAATSAGSATSARTAMACLSVVPDVLHDRLGAGFVRDVVDPDVPSAFGCKPCDIGSNSPAATSDKQYAHVSHFFEVAGPPMCLMMTRARLAAPSPSRASAPPAPSCP